LPPRRPDDELLVRVVSRPVRPTLDERGLWSPFTSHTCSPGACDCRELRPASRRRAQKTR
jgi:hypothetical protein